MDTFNFTPCRQFDFTSILRSGAFGIVGKQVGDSMGRSQSKAAAAGVSSAANASVPDTEVDPVGAADQTAARVGRAALISTSSEGVLGTSPVGRRKLLGN